MSAPTPNNPQPPSAGKSSPRFELITLGEELLLGLTANGHLTWIGAQLGRRGILLERQVTITDEAEAIARQIRESWSRADIIITTGGLGPTCDDRTREIVAESLGQTLVFDDEIMRSIEERFARLQRPCTPNNRKQAYRFA
ncbi:MAG: molybdopterin-binding protein, partial [Candidatus Didemnitutus sp.]|nr:molybdopterin-binding protein [Candidatus Didemnitutus sp.]